MWLRRHHGAKGVMHWLWFAKAFIIAFILKWMGALSPLGAKIYPPNARNMEEKILAMFSLQSLEAILNLDLHMMECVD